MISQAFRLFDAHLHIIDQRFPLVPNQGYVPKTFECSDYLGRMAAYPLAGGAVVSGSFQAFDQTYLLDALARLGPAFVGVTQVPSSLSDETLGVLDHAGVRGVRFNLKRGGSEDVRHLSRLAWRVYERVGWHLELYVDSSALAGLSDVLITLPSISIDHLGLSKEGFPDLLRLVERGARVKATGFGRVDFSVSEALRDLFAANPDAVMFGTDLPSTRAPRPFQDDDVSLVVETLGPEGAHQVLYANAVKFYRPRQVA